MGWDGANMALVESVVGLLEALDHTLVLFQRVCVRGGIGSSCKARSSGKRVEKDDTREVSMHHAMAAAVQRILLDTDDDDDDDDEDGERGGHNENDDDIDEDKEDDEIENGVENELRTPKDKDEERCGW